MSSGTIPSGITVTPSSNPGQQLDMTTILTTLQGQGISVSEWGYNPHVAFPTSTSTQHRAIWLSSGSLEVSVNTSGKAEKFTLDEGERMDIAPGVVTTIESGPHGASGADGYY